MKDIEAVLKGDYSPGVYELETRATADELSHLAAKYGFSLFHIDGGRAWDKRTFLREAATAMSFPSYFGGNWGAFMDCMRDLRWSPAKGYVLLYDRFENFAEGDPQGWKTANEIFRDAVGFWKERKGAPMYVLLRPKSAAAARR